MALVLPYVAAAAPYFFKSSNTYVSKNEINKSEFQMIAKKFICVILCLAYHSLAMIRTNRIERTDFEVYEPKNLDLETEKVLKEIR